MNAMAQLSFDLEAASQLAYQGQWLAGVDEVGRGPLVGSVVAAAVILDPDKPLAGLTDSKRLSEKKRQQLAAQIPEHSLAWAIAEVSAAEIDQLNILHASLKAMRLALTQLNPAPEFALIDGNRIPVDLPCPAEAWVKGDARHPAIAAASILAKVARDQQMLELHQQHPQYGFDQHKGYPTQAHLAVLEKLGPLDCHRRSFGPIKRLLNLRQ